MFGMGALLLEQAGEAAHRDQAAIFREKREEDAHQETAGRFRIVPALFYAFGHDRQQFRDIAGHTGGVGGGIEAERIHPDRAEPFAHLRLRQILQHDASGGLGTANDAGDACAGVGACAHEIVVLDHIVAVVAAQVSALPQHRLEAEGAAHVGVQVLLEVLGRVAELGDDPVVDVGDEAATELVEDHLFKLGANFVPVDRHLAHVADGNERIERALARRRHAGIGHSGVVEIDREIFRHHAVFVDIVEQAFVALGKQDHVVGDAGPGAFKTEMHHEQRGAEALAGKALGHLLPARRA